MTVRIEKIAAALFAIGLAYVLQNTIVNYATEPKVIGGLDFDKPIPQIMHWSPIYYPMLLAASFAYWVWPTTSYRSLARQIAGGCFAIVRTTYFTLFVSILCPGLGSFYLAFPQLMTAELPWALLAVFLEALGGTAVMGLFFAITLVPPSIIVGSLITLCGHCIQRALGSGFRPDQGKHEAAAANIPIFRK